MPRDPRKPLDPKIDPRVDPRFDPRPPRPLPHPEPPPVVDPGDFGRARLDEILEPRLLKQVLDRLQAIAPKIDVPPGRTVPPVNVNPDATSRLLPAGLVVACGLNPATTPSPPPPVLWDDGADQLLVHLAEATMRTGNGFIDLSLVVECDETGRVPVVSTFLTASPERPAGVVWATEDRPRGPSVVVDRWGDALVALGWRALLEVTRTVANAQGTDTFGRPLVASTVVATADGLQITPMGAHPFMATAATRASNVVTRVTP